MYYYKFVYDKEADGATFRRFRDGDQAVSQYLPDFQAAYEIMNDKFIVNMMGFSRNSSIDVDSYVVDGMTSRAKGGVNHLVKKLIPHPKRDRLIYDLALIKTKTPFQYNEHVQPVLVPKDYQPLPVGSLCTVTGWGKLYKKDAIPDILQKTSLTILDPDYFSEKHAAYAKYFSGPAACLICVGVKDSSTDTCTGETGGGLVCDGIVYGLVPWGCGCANRAYIYNLRNFIYSNVDFE